MRHIRHEAHRTPGRPARHRAALSAVAAGAVLSLAAGCATLPTSTEPHVLHPFNETQGPLPDEEPTKGIEADLILREFFAASANPTGDFAAARKYLTTPMAQAWQPRTSVLVVESFELSSRASTDQAKRSFTVSGRILGTLQPGGAFVPEGREHSQYEAQMELAQENGEWRIASMPDDVVVDRIELRNHYEPRNLYFYDPSGQALVSDRRWVYSRVRSLGSALMSMLVDGPSDIIAPAVFSAAPDGVVFAGYNDGVYEFTGFTGADEQTRARFAAQAVWALNAAGVPGPYVITADGTELVRDTKDLTTDDFADLNPIPLPDGGPDLYTLSDGAVASVDNIDTGQSPVVTPVEALDKLGSISQIDIGDDGAYAAAVNVASDQQSLVVGTLDGRSREVLRAGSLTRPTLEPDHNAAWAVADGRRIVRVSRSAATGDVSTSDVEFTLPAGMNGEITVLRLSHTGARVAMIVDGHLVVGVVERRGDGTRAVVNTIPYAADLNAAAVSADWQPDGSLLVGTSLQQYPVVRVEQDGSAETILQSGNVSGPVVAVGATTQTMYITDSKVLMRMPVSNREALNWREVPGKQGVRAAPVVPRP